MAFSFFILWFLFLCTSLTSSNFFPPCSLLPYIIFLSFPFLLVLSSLSLFSFLWTFSYTTLVELPLPFLLFVDFLIIFSHYILQGASIITISAIVVICSPGPYTIHPFFFLLHSHIFVDSSISVHY